MPIKGTSVRRSGVYQTLGITADGRLLALGADPAAGVPALTKITTGWVSSTPPALWAWNSRTGRWDVASTHIPCEDLQSLLYLLTGRYSRHRGRRQVAGTWFWISATVNTDQNAPPTQAYYRVYIPAA